MVGSILLVLGLCFNRYFFHNDGLNRFVVWPGSSIPNSINDLLPIDNLPENRVIVGQWIVRQHNKKLAAVRVWPGICHGYHTVFGASAS